MTTNKGAGQKKSPSRRGVKEFSYLEKLHRLFTIPENRNTTLGKLEGQISKNLMGFLKEHIVAEEISASVLEQDFLDTNIPREPTLVSEETEYLLGKVMAKSVHTSSPSFVGHMTSALPYFMLPLAKIMIALNQNLVKMETSKAFTPLERQVVGMLHRLVFRRGLPFYRSYTQDYDVALGSLCADGTIANLTALWVALGKLLAPREGFAGVGKEGILAGSMAYGFKGLNILVSSRGHYSLKKAANLLGLGSRAVVEVPTDDDNKIRLDLLERALDQLSGAGHGIVAVVGIAGTTETGNVDPLAAMADILARRKIHFHVDAAWGGPTLFSRRFSHLLAGIERADSVTIDAHKQLYVPVGAGLALFRSERDLKVIEHHAEYVIRRGSRDLGRLTVEGSRPGMAMLLHAGLRVLGRPGYELLIDLGIDKAQRFAEMIERQRDFELVTRPELNLLTYRYVPRAWREELATAEAKRRAKINEKLNRLTVAIQKEQREGGKTFVSRTALKLMRYDEQRINVFRVVLANPLTEIHHLHEILAEQRAIGRRLTEDPQLSTTLSKGE